MMNVDWSFLARDLGARLASETDTERRELILHDAQEDAARLFAPPDFWSQVAREYEARARYVGLEASDQVRATARRLLALGAAPNTP
jgi:hypothetical protein